MLLTLDHLSSLGLGFFIYKMETQVYLLHIYMQG